MLIQVRHNIEVAHRLSLLKGKCENIHGHSMWVELSLMGTYVNDKGIICNYHDDPLEFGDIKKSFRSYLDHEFDHRLLLNKSDPWAQELYDKETEGLFGAKGHLPGLKVFPGDPSTENIALWVAEWASTVFRCDSNVLVRETAVNAAAMGVRYKIGGEANVEGE